MRQLRFYPDNFELVQLVGELKEEIKKAQDPLYRALKKLNVEDEEAKEIISLFFLFSEVKPKLTNVRKVIRLIKENQLTLDQLEEKKRELEELGVVVGDNFDLTWLEKPVEEIFQKYTNRLFKEIKQLKKELDEIREIQDYPEVIKTVEPGLSERSKVFRKLVGRLDNNLVKIIDEIEEENKRKRNESWLHSHNSFQD